MNMVLVELHGTGSFYFFCVAQFSEINIGVANFQVLNPHLLI